MNRRVVVVPNQNVVYRTRPGGRGRFASFGRDRGATIPTPEVENGGLSSSRGPKLSAAPCPACSDSASCGGSTFRKRSGADVLDIWSKSGTNEALGRLFYVSFFTG